MLGRSEFALRQGFAAQNACTAQKRRFFGSSGPRGEQGTNEARKRPSGAFGARCACRGVITPRASLVARSIEASQRKLWCFSFCPRKAADFPAHGAEGICRLRAAESKGIFSFAKENIPFGTPRERFRLAAWGLNHLYASGMGMLARGVAALALLYDLVCFYYPLPLCPSCRSAQ